MNFDRKTRSDKVHCRRLCGVKWILMAGTSFLSIKTSQYFTRDFSCPLIRPSTDEKAISPNSSIIK